MLLMRPLCARIASVRIQPELIRLPELESRQVRTIASGEIQLLGICSQCGESCGAGLMGTVVPAAPAAAGEVLVRFYDKCWDVEKVLALERKCEAGESGTNMALVQDLLGDPLSRVRHYPSYAMLVAEVDNEIVGVIRAGIKTIVCGTESAEFAEAARSQSTAITARVAYLLGLRVSPTHRRMGIGLKLANRMEEWCQEQVVQYIYFATTKENVPSYKLFTDKLHYTAFRHPVLLGHPVWRHSLRLPSHVEVSKLSVEAAIAMYRSVMGRDEFFPQDISGILNHKLCAGTWVATLREDHHSGLCCAGSCKVSENVGTIESSFAMGDDARTMPSSWAVLSLWKCNESFSMQLKGVPLYKQMGASISRCLDKALPWCRIPSFPNIFRPFGVQFLFGVHAEGPQGSELFTALCRHAHNLSRQNGCQVILTEVGASDPLRQAIPYWSSFSSEDDVWCVKKLPKLAKCYEVECNGKLSRYDWSRVLSPTPSKMFVDPRDV